MRQHVGLHFVLFFFARLTVVLFQSLVQFSGSVFAHRRVQIFGNVVQVHFTLGFADLFLNFFNERTLFFDLFVTEQDRADHLFVGDLFRARFDHHDGVLGARKPEGKGALLALRVVGIDDEFAVYEPYLHGTRRARPGNIRNAQSDGTSEHGERLGRNVRIDGKRGGDDHHVVIQPLGEQRADGTVDQAGNQDAFIARSAFAFFETAGNFAYRIHFLFEIDLQREEVHALSGRFGHRHVDHHDRIAAADHARTVSLFRVFARFDEYFSSADLGFEYFEILCHFTLLDCSLRGHRNIPIT